MANFDQYWHKAFMTGDFMFSEMKNHSLFQKKKEIKYIGYI